MSLVTKQDILKPKGQKFGIGDLVCVDDDGDELVGHSGHYRVLGSYYQLCGGENESEIDEEDYVSPDCPELAKDRKIEQDEWQSEKEEYSLCRADDREDTWAWCDESRMEAVPEDMIQGEME